MTARLGSETDDRLMQRATSTHEIALSLTRTARTINGLHRS